MENIIAPFTSGLLTGLREGVEAALIVGIIAGYLVKIGRGDRLFVIWTGVGLAVLASALIGAGTVLSAFDAWCRGPHLTRPPHWLFDPALREEAIARVGNATAIHVFETSWASGKDCAETEMTRDRIKGKAVSNLWQDFIPSSC